ncbi:hypothetical protein IU459_11990 [Nocardia amamiensis]|uniref:Uncharacterized protein n=1 Tax=Nocardia amamiensis TaxID=404578 RepID=A0ABS0CR33_9NOCA|nr:hypothetical protein [Nocardia amamiensis]MBF6298262.1 hypothetical protein [Nocardia amamiensis]
MTEPTNLQRRLANVIGENATSSGDGGPLRNSNTTAGAILADAALCAAIGDYVAANDPNDDARQLEAIDLVLAHLDEYRANNSVAGWSRLRDDLDRLRRHVDDRLSEDIDLGNAFLNYAAQFADCHTPAGVGGLIRAAIAKTGATITPGPKPKAAATASEETDRA